MFYSTNGMNKQCKSKIKETKFVYSQFNASYRKYTALLIEIIEGKKTHYTLLSDDRCTFGRILLKELFTIFKLQRMLLFPYVLAQRFSSISFN